jgi:RNA polymerase sigma factor (sigma-70 family)
MGYLPMSTAPTVSHWIAGLKEGNADAAQRLWERYAMGLVELARRRLRDAPKRMADEEDIATSVFHSLCRGAAEGRLQNIKNRDDLWWLLLAITKQKVVDHVRRERAQKRGAHVTQSETAIATSGSRSNGFTLDCLVGDEPTPEFLVMLAEESQRLIGLLRDERLRRIAISRIEGYTVPEIAAEMAVSTRSVERKLKLIRTKWAYDLSGVG